MRARSNGLDRCSTQNKFSFRQNRQPASVVLVMPSWLAFFQQTMRDFLLTRSGTVAVITTVSNQISNTSTTREARDRNVLPRKPSVMKHRCSSHQYCSLSGDETAPFGWLVQRQKDCKNDSRRGKNIRRLCSLTGLGPLLVSKTTLFTNLSKR